jgi:hypothetical protein
MKLLAILSLSVSAARLVAGHAYVWGIVKSHQTLDGEAILTVAIVSQRPRPRSWRCRSGLRPENIQQRPNQGCEEHRLSLQQE